jgi:hypothetical protein
MPFLGIPLTIMQHWSQIKDFFSNLGSWLKQKLHDMFDFEIPHFKLPHLSIDGSFSIAPPSVPSVGVKWYSDGAIFNKRTILGGIGVGDRNHGSGDNPEVVAPLDLLLKHIDKIGQNGNMPSEITLNFNNILDGKQIGRSSAKYVDTENGWQLI